MQRLDAFVLTLVYMAYNCVVMGDTVVVDYKYSIKNNTSIKFRNFSLNRTILAPEPRKIL